MYCKECGNKIDNENASICVKCGTRIGVGNNFCNNCGNDIKSNNAEFCINCGSALTGSNEKSNVLSSNSKIIASALALFCGYTGLHRFYLGYKEIGFIQLAIFLVALFIYEDAIIISIIWSIVDLILILTGKLNKFNGEKLIW